MVRFAELLLPDPILQFSKDVDEQPTKPQGCVASRKSGEEREFKKGRWTKEEHIRFIIALKKFGKEWKSVQSVVGSRSST
jgi:hypothetical protein